MYNSVFLCFLCSTLQPDFVRTRQTTLTFLSTKGFLKLNNSGFKRNKHLWISQRFVRLIRFFKKPFKKEIKWFIFYFSL